MLANSKQRRRHRQPPIATGCRRGGGRAANSRQLFRVLCGSPEVSETTYPTRKAFNEAARCSFVCALCFTAFLRAFFTALLSFNV